MRRPAKRRTSAMLQMMDIAPREPRRARRRRGARQGEQDPGERCASGRSGERTDGWGSPVSREHDRANPLPFACHPRDPTAPGSEPNVPSIQVRVELVSQQRGGVLHRHIETFVDRYNTRRANRYRKAPDAETRFSPAAGRSNDTRSIGSWFSSLTVPAPGAMSDSGTAIAASSRQVDRCCSL